MEDEIGRETLLELLTLQISILERYKKLLEHDQRKKAKKALNEVLKAAIAAVEPIVTWQHMAYDEAVGVHEDAVKKTHDLLKKLLDEEKERAEMHKRMRQQASERGGRQT